MANFSDFVARHLIEYIANPEMTPETKAATFPELNPLDFSISVQVALLTSGVDLKLLAKGGGTGDQLQNEVLENAETKYVRKHINSWVSITQDPASEHLLWGYPIDVPDEKGYYGITNFGDITWNDLPTEAWGTVTHYAILAIATLNGGVTPPAGGAAALRKVLMWGALTNPKTVNIGDIFSFPAGKLVLHVY